MPEWMQSKQRVVCSFSKRGPPLSFMATLIFVRAFNCLIGFAHKFAVWQKSRHQSKKKTRRVVLFAAAWDVKFMVWPFPLTIWIGLVCICITVGAKLTSFKVLNVVLIGLQKRTRSTFENVNKAHAQQLTLQSQQRQSTLFMRIEAIISIYLQTIFTLIDKIQYYNPLHCALYRTK
jgi:hypothetical protein